MDAGYEDKWLASMYLFDSPIMALRSFTRRLVKTANCFNDIISLKQKYFGIPRFVCFIYSYFICTLSLSLKTNRSRNFLEAVCLSLVGVDIDCSPVSMYLNALLTMHRSIFENHDSLRP